MADIGVAIVHHDLPATGDIDMPDPLDIPLQVIFY